MSSTTAGKSEINALVAVRGQQWVVSQVGPSGDYNMTLQSLEDGRYRANLTQSGVDRNIEAGLLIQGGAAPQRAAEHVAELKTRGVLVRLGT